MNYINLELKTRKTQVDNYDKLLKEEKEKSLRRKNFFNSHIKMGDGKWYKI